MSSNDQAIGTAGFTSLLAGINRHIYSDDHTADNKTLAFYQFKPFSAGLKRAEINDWANLQTKLLNPFAQGHDYRFISHAGVHLWFSQTPFKGVPETALQAALPDGSQIAQGQFFRYLQEWQDGLLIKCVAMPVENSPSESSPTEDHLGNADSRSSWAVQRKLDKAIRSPHSYLWLSLFVFLCICAWMISGTLTQSVQLHQAEETIAELSNEVGDALAIESSQRQMLADNQLIERWASEQGFLPESYGLVARHLNQQGDWTPNVLRWQNKVFELEFTAANVDLALLVQNLENEASISSVNLRPHNAANTWILEAQIQ